MAIELVKPGVAIAVALAMVTNMGWEEVSMKVDEHGGRRSSFPWRIGVRLATACIVSYVCAVRKTIERGGDDLVPQGVMTKRGRTMVRPLTEKHYYLNFAETSQPEGRETGSLSCMPPSNGGEQAVRSLGPLGCTCYQACTRGLATRWSAWDLHLS